MAAGHHRPAFAQIGYEQSGPRQSAHHRPEFPVIAVLHNLHPVINRPAGDPGKRDPLLDHVAPFDLYPVERQLHRSEIAVYPGLVHVSKTISPAVEEYLDYPMPTAAYDRLDHYIPVSSQHR
ncbi:hypothetical protein D3C73_941670 [compost metagenome]